MIPAPVIAIFDGIGGMEMILIFVVSLVLFGGKKLPEVARGLGKAVRTFKQAASGVEDEIRKAMDVDSPPPPRSHPPYQPVRPPRPITPTLPPAPPAPKDESTGTGDGI